MQTNALLAWRGFYSCKKWVLHFVPRSVCTGSADLTGEFCLGTMSYSRPAAIVGSIWDMIFVSHVVIVCTTCEEFGWHVNMGLLCLLPCLVRAHRFASLVVTPQGNKSCGRPCAPLHPPTRTPVASSPPSVRLKRER
jgi:hypothetical protein